MSIIGGTGLEPVVLPLTVFAVIWII